MGAAFGAGQFIVGVIGLVITIIVLLLGGPTEIVLGKVLRATFHQPPDSSSAEAGEKKLRRKRTFRNHYFHRGRTG